MIYRQAGDKNLLVEYGPLELDLNLRFRAHALMQSLQHLVDSGTLSGILDLTPGIRSLQIHFDSTCYPATSCWISYWRRKRNCRMWNTSKSHRVSCISHCPGMMGRRGWRSRNICNRYATTRRGARAISSSSAG